MEDPPRSSIHTRPVFRLASLGLPALFRPIGYSHGVRAYGYSPGQWPGVLQRDGKEKTADSTLGLLDHFGG